LGVWSSFQSSNHCSPLVLSCCTTISESMVVRTISLAIYIKSKNLNGLASPCNSEMIGDHSTKQESSEDRKEHWGVIPHQNAYLKHWFTYSLALLNGSERRGGRKVHSYRLKMQCTVYIVHVIPQGYPRARYTCLKCKTTQQLR